CAHVPARRRGHRFDPAHVQESCAPLRQRRARGARVREGYGAVRARIREQERLRPPFARTRLPWSPCELRRARASAPLRHAAGESREAGWLQLERVTVDTRYPLGLMRAWSY